MVDEVLVEAFKVVFMKSHFACFKPRGWLNDEVGKVVSFACDSVVSACNVVSRAASVCRRAQSVNFYGELVMLRHAKRVRPKRLHWFNSYFYEQLMQAANKNRNGFSYDEVQRWTAPRGRKLMVDIFELDELMFPIHVGQVCDGLCCSVCEHPTAHAVSVVCAEPLDRYCSVFARKED